MCRPNAAFLLTAALLQGGCARQAPGGAEPERVAEANAFLDLLVDGAYDQAVERFDETMREVMPAAKLQEAWEQIVGEAGKLVERLRSTPTEAGGLRAVVVTCRFERATLDLRVVFDDRGRVSGFWAKPAEASSTYEPPDYVDPATFAEREVTVGADPWELPATLALPAGAGPHPAVVLVHGSGPNDRNETIGPNQPFRDLSGGLASRGIAVLRYDKRTKVHGKKVEAMAGLRGGLTVREETIDDAVAAVALLRATEGIDPARIVVLGHSLGGMLIPRIGLADESIAGFVIAAGITRPLHEVTVEQLDYIASISGDLSAQEQAQLEALRAQAERIADPDLPKETPATELLGAPGSYWLDLRAHDPATEAKELRRPILVLQGGRDYQATKADFDGWKAALTGRPEAKFRFYANLNHLFAPGEGKATPAEYQKPNHVAGEVIEDIAAFVSALGQATDTAPAPPR